MARIKENDVSIFDGWICVDGVGTIGRYLRDVKCIGLDYSMKWIVGTNDRIRCSESEVKKEIVRLFNPT